MAGGELAPPWRAHFGGLLLGWDLGFLAFGALLVLAGWALRRSAVRPAPATA